MGTRGRLGGRGVLPDVGSKKPASINEKDACRQSGRGLVECRYVNEPQQNHVDRDVQRAGLRTAALAFVFFHLVVDWFLPSQLFSTSRITQLLLPFLLGIIMGQATLLAFWMALAAAHLGHRLLVGYGLAIAAVYASLFGRQTMTDEFVMSRSPGVIGPGGVMFVAGVAVLHALFWVVGRRKGWRLLWQRAAETGTRVDAQYDLQFLLTSVFAVAFLLAVGRLTVPAEIAILMAQSTRADVVALVGIWATLLIANAVLATLCMWSAYARRPSDVITAGWILAPLLVFCEVLVVFQLPGVPPPELDTALGLLAANASQCVCVFGALWALRRKGFRLERLRATT